jgi:hypothetical protein
MPLIREDIITSFIGFAVNVLLILSNLLLGTALIWSLTSRFVFIGLCVTYFKLLDCYFQVMVVTVRVIQRDFHERKANFQPRPYFRLFVTWLVDFNAADPILDSSNFQVHAHR